MRELKQWKLADKGKSKMNLRRLKKGMVGMALASAFLIGSGTTLSTSAQTQGRDRNQQEQQAQERDRDQQEQQDRDDHRDQNRDRTHDVNRDGNRDTNRDWNRDRNRDTNRDRDWNRQHHERANDRDWRRDRDRNDDRNWNGRYRSGNSYPRQVPYYGTSGGYGRNGGYSNGEEQRGFRDGLDRGQEDVRDRRSPNPNNSEHFRNGNAAYREGFRRGYEQGYRQYGGSRRW